MRGDCPEGLADYGELLLLLTHERVVCSPQLSEPQIQWVLKLNATW